MALIKEDTTENFPLPGWKSSPDCTRSDPSVTADKFREVTNLLLERPNLNSSHLFRADILYDSAGICKTIKQKETNHNPSSPVAQQHGSDTTSAKTCYPKVEGYTIIRSVIRRLIPRKPRLDNPLEQLCLILESTQMPNKSSLRQLVIYEPRTKPGERIPWYHPDVQRLAYFWIEEEGISQLSVHYQLHADASEEPPTRLHRTMLSLTQTFIRLAKIDSPSTDNVRNGTPSVLARSTAPSALKDTILPQHVVQDTYTRLKETYASDLINRWVEKTEPSKHVFEDLSIAAFLIELWKQMYVKQPFPGFVDLACGNGVLVYILLREGYQGYGLDARRRTTWQILDIEDHLEEKLCVPKPFLTVKDSLQGATTVEYHDGIFVPGTFIISNHADELTPWTPILSFLSCPSSPLPFLAIPCCSHALSGSSRRYSWRDIDPASAMSLPAETGATDRQPSSGDLKALRKTKTQPTEMSQYACLTKKTVALAEELGYEAEMTLLRIPSTRNIGIVGNRRLVSEMVSKPTMSAAVDVQQVLEKLDAMLTRECAKDGGIHAAAEKWMARAQKLHTGVGRGKLNLGSKPNVEHHNID